jgi:hypothetical protein
LPAPMLFTKVSGLSTRVLNHPFPLIQQQMCPQSSARAPDTREREKGHKRAWHRAAFPSSLRSSESCSVVGVADALSGDCRHSLRSVSRSPSPSSLALLGLLLRRCAPCPRTPHRGRSRVPPPMPLLRFASSRTPSADDGQRRFDSPRRGPPTNDPGVSETNNTASAAGPLTIAFEWVTR